MLNDSENKMMNAADPKDAVTFKAASGMQYDFFFPGSGKWKAKTVRAVSREEAQQIWEATREPVQQEAPPAVEEVKPIATSEEKEEKVEE
jgi:hypothetical protein